MPNATLQEKPITLPVTHKGKSVDHVNSKRVFETREKEREREQAFDTVQREAKKLPGIQRKIAIALMGEGRGRGTMKEATQRIGISPASFYREKEKVRQKLKKLKPVWVRFGKALSAMGGLMRFSVRP